MNPPHCTMISAISFLSFSVLLITSNAAIYSHDSPISQVYQFSNMTWVENIAVRSNGQLLLSMLTQPELWSINPLDPHPKPSLVYQFPNATGLFGVVEIEPDVFAVVATSFALTSDISVPNSVAIWKVNLRKRAPEVHKAANIPAGGSLNGLARLSRNAVLGSDTRAGVVHRIDLDTGNSAIVLQDETMNGPIALPTYGVDGIRIHGRYLYYDNVGKGLFCRISIDLDTGAATGPVEIISDAVQGADDFALSKTAHTAYVANFLQNSLARVSADGEVQVIAGGPDGALFHGPTSAQFGRTPLDRDIVYVVSSGATFNQSAISGFDFLEGGKVVAVKVRD
ncbi:quino protein amine dehydrogenase beta chain-like protein [Phaeosphaeriaceae sp. PMI808]|nr:quino protein amine dehydrogenase beta chain-like protein [Phaeosphaeriaceae sp. PMI808]